MRRRANLVVPPTLVPSIFTTLALHKAYITKLKQHNLPQQISNRKPLLFTPGRRIENYFNTPGGQRALNIDESVGVFVQIDFMAH